MKSNPVKLKKILLTTDFSGESRSAFPAAAELARKFAAELHLIHLLERIPADLFLTPEGGQVFAPEIDWQKRIAEMVVKSADEEPSFRGLPVTTHLLEGGSIQDRLARFEEEERIDLTIISAGGRSSLGRFFLGSFAEKVVRLARSPVLVYRAPPAGSPAGFSPRRILVPYDFSENSRTILGFVRFFADAYDAEVRIQHVLEPLPDLALIPWEGFSGEEIQERRSDAPIRGREELQALIAREFPGRPKFDAIADFGTPFVDIVRAARDFEADLILMATHGWTGLRHMLLGSVTEKVVRKAACSVLTVRPAGLRFEEP